jgi:hypothetical protein
MLEAIPSADLSQHIGPRQAGEQYRNARLRREALLEVLEGRNRFLRIEQRVCAG